MTFLEAKLYLIFRYLKTPTRFVKPDSIKKTATLLLRLYVIQTLHTATEH